MHKNNCSTNTNYSHLASNDRDNNIEAPRSNAFRPRLLYSAIVSAHDTYLVLCEDIKPAIMKHELYLSIHKSLFFF